MTLKEWRFHRVFLTLVQISFVVRMPIRINSNLKNYPKFPLQTNYFRILQSVRFTRNWMQFYLNTIRIKVSLHFIWEFPPLLFKIRYLGNVMGILQGDNPFSIFYKPVCQIQLQYSYPALIWRHRNEILPIETILLRLLTPNRHQNSRCHMFGK